MPPRKRGILLTCTAEVMSDDSSGEAVGMSTQQPDRIKPAPALDADGTSTRVMDIQAPTNSQELNDFSVADFEPIQREEAKPDTLTTFGLLENDTRGEFPASQEALQDVFESHDTTAAQQATGADINASGDLAQMITRIQPSDDKQSLGELIQDATVPLLPGDETRAKIIKQSEPPPRYSGQKPAASKATARESIPHSPTRRKAKKRGGKGSYRCTRCGKRKENHICQAFIVPSAEAGTQTEETVQTEGSKFLVVGRYCPADDSVLASRGHENPSASLHTGNTTTRPREATDEVSIPRSSRKEQRAQTDHYLNLLDNPSPEEQDLLVTANTSYVDSDEEIETVAV